jgi:hydrogenase maturation protease
MSRRILVIGYGNPGRGDDGLGPALAERLESLRLPQVSVESDYQLTIEHAAMAAEHDVVVFADAALDSEALYYFRPVAAAQGESFSSHSVTPGGVLLLAQSCFNAHPEAYLLGIRPVSMDRFEEGLSAGARAALEAALEYLLRFIAEDSA